MKILWRPEMSVGHDVLDDDHQKLIQLVNRFMEATESGCHGADLTQVLDRLSKYVAIHFSREEELQKTIGFPFSDAHHGQHEAIKARLVHVRERVATASEDALAGVAGEIADLLRTWVLNHVLRCDLPIRTFFQQARETGRLKRRA